jgi:hypothetical protein
MLLDDVVGDCDQRRRNSKPKHSDRLGVDNQLNLARLQGRQISGLGALEDGQPAALFYRPVGA